MPTVPTPADPSRFASHLAVRGTSAPPAAPFFPKAKARPGIAPERAFVIAAVGKGNLYRQAPFSAATRAYQRALSLGMRSWVA